MESLAFDHLSPFAQGRISKEQRAHDLEQQRQDTSRIFSNQCWEKIHAKFPDIPKEKAVDELRELYIRVAARLSIPNVRFSPGTNALTRRPPMIPDRPGRFELAPGEVEQQFLNALEQLIEKAISEDFQDTVQDSALLDLQQRRRILEICRQEYDNLNIEHRQLHAIYTTEQLIQVDLIFQSEQRAESIQTQIPYCGLTMTLPGTPRSSKPSEFWNGYAFLPLPEKTIRIETDPPSQILRSIESDHSPAMSAQTEEGLNERPTFRRSQYSKPETAKRPRSNSI